MATPVSPVLPFLGIAALTRQQLRAQIIHPIWSGLIDQFRRFRQSWPCGRIALGLLVTVSFCAVAQGQAHPNGVTPPCNAAAVGTNCPNPDPSPSPTPIPTPTPAPTPSIDPIM